MVACTQNPGTSPIGRRKTARLRLGIPAVLLLIEGTHRCRLLDLSLTGARIGLEKDLRIGDDAVLQFTGFEAFGTVVWSDLDQIGMRFDEDLPESLLIEMREFNDRFRERSLAELRSSVNDWVNGSSRLI